MRCERCRTNELTLETFGVYQCPSCGRVDADGNRVGGDSTLSSGEHTQPNMLETGRASFAAPPPVYNSTTAQTIVTRPVVASRDLPTLFLGTVAIMALLDIVEAVHAGSPLTLVLQAGTMVALVTGKPWARTLAMVGAVGLIGLAAMLFVFVHGRGPYGLASAITIVMNGWWIYVLVRPDTVAYFSR